MRVFARVAGNVRKRVLFVEDTIPLRMLGSGYVRSNDIVWEMASLGYAVTVYPLNGSSFDVASVYADMPDSVEVMHNGSLRQFQGLLTLRRDYYDVIWVVRTHNLAVVRAMVEQSVAEQGQKEVAPGEVAPGEAVFSSGVRPSVVLDTEAIASVRDAGQAVLE